MILMFMLTLAVIIAAVGSLPIWRHSKNWGFYPTGGISVVILFIIILLFAGNSHLR
jgi:low affinity Fe/Cu permease